jgi:hypothetical protein
MCLDSYMLLVFGSVALLVERPEVGQWQERGWNRITVRRKWMTDDYKRCVGTRLLVPRCPSEYFNLRSAGIQLRQIANPARN